MVDAEPAQKKGSRLGRGLENLIPSAESQDESARELPIDVLTPSPYQPRRTFSESSLAELADSIREHGIIQPLLVRAAEDGQYQIIAGERRWRAAQRAQLHNVPVTIRPSEDEAAASIALIENIQRDDLSPIEEARGFLRLSEEFNKTQDEIAESVGKSRPYIANALRLLSLPETVQTHIEAGQLSAGHARALIGQEDAEDLAEHIIGKNLTVRKTEALIKSRRQPSEAPSKSSAIEDNSSSQDQLSDDFSLDDEMPPQLANSESDDVDPKEVNEISEDLREAVKNLSNLVEFEASARDSNTAEIEDRLSDLTGLEVYFTLNMETDGGTLSFKYDTLEQLDALLIRFGIVQ